MIINLSIEVESRQALATILKTGSEYSLFDYHIIGKITEFPAKKG